MTRDQERKGLGIVKQTSLNSERSMDYNTARTNTALDPTAGPSLMRTSTVKSIKIMMLQGMTKQPILADEVHMLDIEKRMD